MSEKSYKPTQKRLREARKRGEVVRSRELTALGAFLAVWLYLWVGAQFMLERLRSIAERALDALGQPWLPQVQSIVSDMFWTVVPLLGLSIAGGVLFASVQTRGVFSMTPITPNFARINPGQGLRNLFSTRNLFELLKLLLKVVLLLGTFFLVITAAIDPLAKLVYAPAADLLRISGTLVWRLMGYAAIVYAVGAALDYAHQSYEFLKQHRMSIEEVRQDYHETEGNPLFKRRRRSIAREALSSAHLSQANVVVADATRVAVALFYVADDTPLPLVIAKGQDESALRIRHQAEREGVPVYEDAALARQLFRDVPLNDYINEAAIEPVGAAFNWAQENDRRGR